MTYVPSLNFNTQIPSGDFVRFFADDMNCGVGGFEISEMMYEITYIQPVNDAPVVTVPGATRVGSPCRESSAAPHDHHEVSIHEKCGRIIHVDTMHVNEDTPLNITGISIEDPDLSSHGMLEVNISVTSGRIQLFTQEGLLKLDDFADDNVHFIGQHLDIQRALSVVRYIPRENFNGVDTLTVWANDMSTTMALTDSQSIPIIIHSVNDEPHFVIPPPFMQQYQHVQEDSTLHIHGVEIVDVDSEIGGYGELHVKISSLHGKVQLFKHEGLRLVQGSWDSGSGLMDFFGNIDDANEALKEMKYTPDLNYNSDIGEIDNISFFVSDMNQTGGHIEFTMKPTSSSYQPSQ